jgi:hypothetical protein
MQGWLNDDTKPDAERGGDSKNRVHTWTDTQSFYALMGGFAFSTHDLPPEKKFLPCAREVAILQLKGLKYVAEHDPSIIPDLSKEEILDKSKAGGLEKAMICAQAVWFLIQLIARIGQGLPICLLEISTAAHAICALLIYILWWDKPMRIGRPTMITGAKMEALCATLCCWSRFDGYRDVSALQLLPRGKMELPTTTVLPSVREVETQPPRESTDPDEKVYRLYDGQCVWRFQYLFNRSRTRYIYDGKYERRPFVQRAYFEYTSRDVRRWRLASPWVDDFSSRLDHDQGVGDRSPDWPQEANFNVFASIVGGVTWLAPKRLPVLAGFSVAGFFYGGLHLLAWRAPFPSKTQSLLWKIAAMNIAASGAYPILGPIPRLLAFLLPERKRIVAVQLVVFAWGNAFMLLTCFYLLSRGFILLECFIQLAYVPPEAFHQAEWSSYWPHIS